MRRLLTLILLVALAGAVFLSERRPLLTAVAQFLIVQDPLDQADTIIVLSGARRDERVRQAAELFRQGYAPVVILSGGEELEGIPIPELQRAQALKHGIPASALRFEKLSTSTAEQARYLRSMLEAIGAHRALVVTSSFHTRRTRYLFRRIFVGSPVDIRVYPVLQDIFTPVEWWTRDWDTEQVVLEYIKLGLAVLRYR